MTAFIQPGYFFGIIIISVLEEDTFLFGASRRNSLVSFHQFEEIESRLC